MPEAFNPMKFCIMAYNISMQTSSHLIKIKNIRTPFLVFIISFAFISFSLNSEYEEDATYVNFAASILLDKDYNIINQVEEKFTWLLTKEHKHPTQHSVIQTPFLSVLTVLNSSLLKFFRINFSDKIFYPAMTLNMFSLLFGFIYCRKTSHLFNVGLTMPTFMFFLTSTSLLFYSVFRLSVIEVYVFPISAFVLFISMQNFKNKESNRASLLLGLAVGILITSKISYVFVLMLSMSSLFFFDHGKRIKEFLKYLLGLLLIIIPSILNEFVQFGEVVFLNSIFAEIICDYSFYNIINTLIFGYFGVGGLFYTNPLFFPVLIYSIYFLISKTSKTTYLWTLPMLLWLGMCFFQTIFLAGFVVDDHYIGRLTLTGLPVIILGFSILVNRFQKYKRFFLPIGIILFIWQCFTIINFIGLDRGNHYGYTGQKVLGSMELFYSVALGYISQIIQHAKENLFYTFIVSMSLAMLTHIIMKMKIKPESIMKTHILVTSLLLGVFSGLNFVTSAANQKEYFKTVKSIEKFVIAKEPRAYVFNYAIDGLKALYKNTNDKKMRERNMQLRRNYYDSLKESFLQTTPEFDEVLKTYNYNYGYYREDK